MLFFALVCQLLLALNVYAQDSGVVMCSSRIPLAACHVRVSTLHGNGFDKILDFGAGPESPSVKLDKYYNASYAGAGLAKGDCGISVDLESHLFVECFGTNLDGQVIRGSGYSSEDGNTDLHLVERTPSHLTVALGGNVTFSYKADRDVLTCTISPPTSGLGFQHGVFPSSDLRYLPLVPLTGSRECGMMLSGVQAKDAGVWLTGLFYNQPNSARPRTSFRTTTVLVQAAPVGEPVLEIKDAASLKIGSILEAKCVAPPAVPHATLTWLLDGKVVRQNNLNDTLPGDIGKSRPWEKQPVRQIFHRVVAPGSGGIRLECRMSHPALDAPRTVQKYLPGEFVAIGCIGPAVLCDL